MRRPKKIRLNVDELAVQSLETGDRAGERGTVRAHAPSTDPRACPRTENGYCTVNEIYCTTPEGCWQNYTVNVSCIETYVCAQQ